MAFKRYQVPYGADQCRRMTRWALHSPNAIHAPRWNGHDQVLGQLEDMRHSDSGAEGLTCFVSHNLSQWGEF
jgi:hypothetical protein